MFGNNSGQMKQMMEQMGIEMEEIETDKITVETKDGREIVFEDVMMNKMDAQNEKIYQIMGEPTDIESTESDGEQDEEEDNEDENTSTESSDQTTVETEITQDDIELVALRAGVDEETAKQTLEENDGDLADSISDLEA